MENLAQFLNGTTTEQNIVLLSYILVAFLLGLALTWAIQNSSIQKLERTLRKKEAHIQTTETEKIQLEDELALKEADLKRNIFEREESYAAQQLLQQENHQIQEELHFVQVELEKALAASHQYLSTIEDLNDQILGLKTRAAQRPPSDTTDMLAQAQATHTLEISHAESRLAALENRIKLLEQQQVKTSAPAASTPLLDERQLEVFADEDLLDESEPDLALHPFVGRPAVPAAPTPTYTDDLTAIDGIGPFLQHKLHEVGVFTFAQISTWDAATIEDITQKIQFFPGRIEKDDWVGQAKRLLENPPEPVADRALEATEDDLKIIEGIGPAIEIILKKAGIHTFEQIAKTDPEEMETILQIADSKLVLYDTDTWPAQASLALNKDWETLQDFQDKLRAARPVLDEDIG